ncbi:LIM/homeobox protein Lhx9-like [Dendroctonus ponderosae]|uniref:LIM/homeobox protein Lhx9-like n=1 Tax=Dendroctonus ponderosae TaxID=77166 RepID=UPI002034DFD5|nr:LIM/homeobox protein Lhx9-like [Dendroctonus ponderosae]
MENVFKFNSFSSCSKPYFVLHSLVIEIGQISETRTVSVATCFSVLQSCGSDTCRPQLHETCRSTPCPPSRPVQSITPPELRRPGSSFDHHIPKIEPDTTPSTPPTPPSSCAEEIGGFAICAGCGNKIRDRYYLQAVERRWHAKCLRCCQCRNTLDGDVTCFSRDGNIYCKKDYNMKFQNEAANRQIWRKR